jgi:aminopeptidase
MDTATLKKFAALLVCTGGNVQKGQPVIISCGVDNAVFARMVQDCAYEAGASFVDMDWVDGYSIRNRYLMAEDESFDEYAPWLVQKNKYYDDKGAVYLTIDSSDPGMLTGVDPCRISRYKKSPAKLASPI